MQLLPIQISSIAPRPNRPSSPARPLIAAALALGAILGASLFASPPAQAEEKAEQPVTAQSVKPMVVVELFTSQGCSSCPPADRFLGKLNARKDVIGLTRPVHYWDYLGWKDNLALPENAARQKLYARQSGTTMIYTPQMVINGVVQAVGSREYAVEAAIKKARQKISSDYMPMKISRVGKHMLVEKAVKTQPYDGKPVMVWMALVTSKAPVSIKRGENRGRKITYYNVVRAMKKVGTWNGAPLKVTLSSHEWKDKRFDHCVILMQRGETGPIIGAAELKNMRTQ